MLQALKILFFVIIAVLPAVSHAAKKKPQTLCVNSSGVILLKNKCKKNEKKFDFATINQAIIQDLKLVGIKGSQGGIGPVGPVGPQGPEGGPGNPGIKGTKGLIDFSGCRKVSSEALNLNQSFMVVTEASATVSCNPNSEFLFNDSFSQASLNSPGNIAVIKTRSSDDFTIAGDKREYLVTYFAERVATAGDGIYKLQVHALCCPR